MGVDHDFLGDFPPFLNDWRISPVEWNQNREREELAITGQPATVVDVAALIQAIRTLNQNAFAWIERMSVKSMNNTWELTWIAPKFARNPDDLLPRF